MLNRARITDAAMKLLKTVGMRGLTIRALADRLGVSPSAIYNHADSRATVFAWVQERLVAEVDASGFGTLPWRQAIERWAWSYFRMLRRHTELVEIGATVPLREADASAQMYERIAYGFRSEGWAVRDVLPSISALESFIFGAAFDSAAPTDIYITGSSAQAPILNAIVAAQHRNAEDTDRDPSEITFELGLHAMLDGLHARHSNATIANE
ncbi:MAG: TetR/AcrR family transcriptional regulator [Gulosibacter sp.]